jgi:hypothetical protein
MDRLYVPTQELWYPALRSKLQSFPAGKHDDQVDALGLIGQILDRMSAGPKQEEPRPLRCMLGISLEELWTAQPKRSSDQRI